MHVRIQIGLEFTQTSNITQDIEDIAEVVCLERPYYGYKLAVFYELEGKLLIGIDVDEMIGDD